MTDTTTEAVERLTECATKAPWWHDNNEGYGASNIWAEVTGDTHGKELLATIVGDSAEADANAAFIAASRDLVPALLAERDALKAQLAASKSPDSVTNEDSCQPHGAKYGNRNVSKMVRQIELLRQAIRSEGTPSVQDAWDKVEEHIDYTYQGQPTRTYEDRVRDALAAAVKPLRTSGQKRRSCSSTLSLTIYISTGFLTRLFASGQLRPSSRRKAMSDQETKMETNMDFGDAIRAMKSGKRVARAGWNGKGMWVAYTPGSTFLKEHAKEGHAEKHRADEIATAGGDIVLLPHIDMRAADGSMVIGWLASQTDMLAEDWAEV